MLSQLNCIFILFFNYILPIAIVSLILLYNKAKFVKRAFVQQSQLSIFIFTIRINVINELF